MKRLLRSVCLIICIIICCASVVSCEDSNAYPEYYDFTSTAMDTVINIRLARNSGNVDEKKKTIYFDKDYLSAVSSECFEIINRIEGAISRTSADSAVSEINGETQHILSPDSEVLSLISESFRISDDTDGAFDITVGTLTELWNVTADAPAVPDDGLIAEALSHVGRDKITIENGDITKNDVKTKLDLGAVGKGYALGKVIEHLETTDVKYGIVSVGGNVGVFGEKPSKDKKDTPEKYKVGITNPKDTAAVSGYLYIDRGYVSVSGDYERYFESDGKRYHHIFDSKTGYPAESDLSSVAVWSDNADEADALSTALFVMGSRGATDFYNSGKYKFEAVLITNDGTVITTSGISDTATFEEYVPENTETE